MSDCGCRNPQIPVYSQAKPVSQPNCLLGCSGMNTILPPESGLGKTTELLAGFAIGITDLSDAQVDRFKVDWEEYVDVNVALSVVASRLGVDKSLPILKGTEIDKLACTWLYNTERDGDISSQSIDVTTGGSDPDPANPTLNPLDRAYNYTGLSITQNASVQIQGSDGISNDSDTENVTFGNYLAIGVVDPSILLADPANIQTLFNALSYKGIKTTHNNVSFDAYGGATEYMLIMYPKAWGLAEFTKGAFTGGYQRIKQTTRSGNKIFTVNLQGGEVEEDVLISNNNPDGAYQEAYYIYQSEFPARTGEKPTIITLKS